MLVTVTKDWLVVCCIIMLCGHNFHMLMKNIQLFLFTLNTNMQLERSLRTVFFQVIIMLVHQHTNTLWLNMQTADVNLVERQYSFHLKRKAKWKFNLSFLCCHSCAFHIPPWWGLHLSAPPPEVARRLHRVCHPHRRVVDLLSEKGLVERRLKLPDI